MRAAALPSLVCALATLASGPAVSGTPSISVDATVTLVQGSGVCDSVSDVSRIDIACVPGMQLPGQLVVTSTAPLALPGVDLRTGLSTLGYASGSAITKTTLLPDTTLVGGTPVSLYSSGAAIGGARSVTSESGSYVEITIAW